jgi:hypothetical protein
MDSHEQKMSNLDHVTLPSGYKIEDKLQFGACEREN